MAYNDINENKMVNKAGILELSGLIKTYIDSNIPANVPDAPSTDGVYILKRNTVNGTVSYTWESITVGGSY